MAFSTENPVEPNGSQDPRDLIDNTKILDKLVNSSDLTWLGRLGKKLKTWAGIMQQVTDYLIAQGYEATYLVYGAGVVVERQTQLVQRSGELYRVMNAADIPLTLTGTWAADAPKLQAVGDAALRQGLAGAGGASIVGESSGGTVQHGLDSLRMAVERADAGMSTTQNCLNQVVDLHYGALKGTGYLSTESGGTVTAATRAAVASGRYLPLASTSAFPVGQLIVYQAKNGEFYSAVVQAKDATNLFLNSPIESPVAAGGLVSNFYADVSHPNVNGFKAIADYSIRHLIHKSRAVITWRPTDGYTTQGTGTIANISGVSYENPGSVMLSALGFTAGSALAGVITPPYDFPAGQYRVRVSLTPTLSGSADPLVSATVAVRETVGGVPTTIAVATAVGASPTLVEAAFRKRAGSTFQVLITSPSTGHQFAVSKIEVLRPEGNIKNLDRGVWVMLGDSWIANPGMTERFQERLPNATFYAKGVGGNRVNQLSDRFEADVVPLKPNVVFWVAGTNDVAQGVTTEVFAYNMGILLSKINEIGADAIGFNVSVGCPTHPTLGDLLTPSRNYASVVPYFSEAPDRKTAGFTSQRAQIPIALNVPASSTRRVAVFPGTTTRGATLNKLYAIGQLGVVTGNIRFGYGGSAGAAISEDIQTLALSTTIRTNVSVTKAAATERFLLVEVENTSASVLEVIGFIDATWVPS
jgi:hypothetical protein